ncbi:hypothetical protein L6V77_26820 [Myxococcota bacterium]|nr:hypothetical protein [Myxococcota bacterium]
MPACSPAIERAVLDTGLAAALEYMTGLAAESSGPIEALADADWPAEACVWATVRLPAPVDARQWVVVPPTLAMKLVNRTWPGLPLEVPMAAHLFGDLVANAACVALASADPGAPAFTEPGVAGFGPCPRPTGAVRAARWSIEGESIFVGLELDEPGLDALDMDWARASAN